MTLPPCLKGREHDWLPVATRGLRIGTWTSGSSTRNSPMMIQCMLCEQEVRRCTAIATNGLRVWQCDDPLNHLEEMGYSTHYSQSEDEQW